MIQPSIEFRESRRERFEKQFELEQLARKGELDKNTAWVMWQAAEALCCNAFYDAGFVPPNV